jgi:hypothetical protein
MRNAIWASVLALAAASCGGGSSSSGGGVGRLQVLLTDAPFAHDIVESAQIKVSAIRVHRDAQADGGFITLPDVTDGTLELLDLQNGLTQLLVDAELPAGKYRQIRLLVEEATLKLINGNEYSTALGNLNLTSTGSSGLKLFVDPPIQINAGATTEILLDFDLSKSFHPVPATDALTATSYLLMPVVRVTNRTATGEIHGTVTEDDGLGGQVGVEAATVYVMPPGETDPLNSIATTGTIADGSYTVLGLAVGTYDVLAIKDPKQGSVLGVDVVVGTPAIVDIVIQ